MRQLNLCCDGARQYPVNAGRVLLGIHPGNVTGKPTSLVKIMNHLVADNAAASRFVEEPGSSSWGCPGPAQFQCGRNSDRSAVQLLLRQFVVGEEPHHVGWEQPHAGGQCAELYGDKPIYDIPGIKVCSGQELTDKLLHQITPFAPHWHWGQQASALQPQDGRGFVVETDSGTRLHARAVFIAAGVGAFMPRALKLPGLERFAGTQMRYRLEDGENLAGQHVVVHGGGEPAASCAIACATAPEHLRPASITLHHRRDVFDAPPEMLAQLQALRDAGKVQVVVGVATAATETGGRLTALELTSPESYSISQTLDLLVVRLGMVPRLGPIADWGLALERKQLVADPATFATNVPGIYAVGDVIAYPGKRKLILSGFHEATLAAFAAAEWLTGEKMPLEYTTSSARLHKLLKVGGSQ